MSRQSIAIGLLWLASLALAAAGWVSLVRSGRLLDISGGQAVFVTLAVLAAPTLATAMNRRHPAEWTGVLLGATVLLAAFAACRSAPLDGFTAVAGPTALVTALLPAAVIARYPALQASRRRATTIVVVATVAAVIGAVVAAIALVTDAVPTPWWVSQHPAPADALTEGLLAGYTATVGVCAALTAALVIERYRSGPRHARATLRPLVYPALGWTISVTTTALWTFVVGGHAPRMDVFGSNAGTTFVFLPTVLVGALAAGIAWLELGVRQPGRTSGIGRVVPPPVQVYLSRALADPSIRVAYPTGTGKAGFADVEHWVDRDGHLIDPSAEEPDRAVAIIQRAGVVIGLVEHDSATASRPDAVELVATGAGLMMETEMLTASANRDLENSRLLATRLLSAADEPRESLRGQLTDGPIAELDAVAVALADGASLAECLSGLAAVTAEVRAISHGVYPEELAVGGLAEALPTVTSIGRQSAAVEMTAYLVARDDPLATIVAADGSLCITTRCNPAAMVRDRVTALGGRVEPSGARWTVEVPIAENSS